MCVQDEDGIVFLFQADGGVGVWSPSLGLGDVYKGQVLCGPFAARAGHMGITGRPTLCLSDDLGGMGNIASFDRKLHHIWTWLVGNPHGNQRQR